MFPKSLKPPLAAVLNRNIGEKEEGLVTDERVRASIGRVRESFAAELVWPDDAGYDAARKVFNGMIDRRPTVIARCSGVRDVLAALSLARTLDLTVAVRGGAHSVCGYGVCDGGIVIDLSPMKGIRIDADARVARAQAGLTWGEFDPATQEFGLAVTGGRVSSTGISGLTLGSGSGWLERRLGLSSDNLLSAEVVTADGRVVTASRTMNDDLFWGLRGGGGNFGIVTEFEFRLHPIGPTVLGGVLLHPAAKAREVLRFYRDFIEAAPDDFGGGFAFMTAPHDSWVPSELRGRAAVGIFVICTGPVNEGEDMARPLREFGPPIVDLVGPMPYTAVQSMSDAAYPHYQQCYYKAEFLSELSDAAIDTAAELAAHVGSPLTNVLFQPQGGAFGRVPDDDSCLGNRDAPWSYHALSCWSDPAESEVHVNWTRAFSEAMKPFATEGIYLNYVGDEGEERIRSTYGPEKFERLVALKDKYDPENVFRLNQNIKPSRQQGPSLARSFSES